jgi:hypothetical protein
MNMWRLVWFVTVEVDPIRTTSEDCRHPKAPPSLNDTDIGLPVQLTPAITRPQREPAKE